MNKNSNSASDQINGGPMSRRRFLERIARTTPTPIEATVAAAGLAATALALGVNNKPRRNGISYEDRERARDLGLIASGGSACIGGAWLGKHLGRELKQALFPDEPTIHPLDRPDVLHNAPKGR